MLIDQSEPTAVAAAASAATRPGPPLAMITAFRTESPQLLLRIQAGSVDGNFQHVRHCARYLRTVALEIGAAPLAEICADIEQHATIGDGEVPVELLHDLFVHWLASISAFGGEAQVRH